MGTADGQHYPILEKILAAANRASFACTPAQLAELSGVGTVRRLDHILQSWGEVTTEILLEQLSRRGLQNHLSREESPLNPQAAPVNLDFSQPAPAPETIRYFSWHGPFGECLVELAGDRLLRLGFGHHNAWPPKGQRIEPGPPPSCLTLFEAPRQRQLPPLAPTSRPSSFRRQLWQSLAATPPGALQSYSKLALGLGRPGAARAIGQGLKFNPLPWLIPCHRVIAADGSLGGYHGQTQSCHPFVLRKQAMLLWELRP